MVKLFLIAMSFVPMLAHGSFSWELVVRADQHRPFQLPLNSQMPNMNVACRQGAVAVRFLVIGTQVESAIRLFLKDDEFVTSPLYSQENLINGPAFFENGQILYSVRDLLRSKGLYGLNALKAWKWDLPRALEQSLSLTSPIWWNGRWLIRSLAPSGYYQLWWGSEKLLDLKDLKVLSQIHLPAVRKRQVALLVAQGLQNEKIQMIQTGEQWPLKTIADSGPDSEFSSFDTSPQPMGNGSVVFFANHKLLGRSLWLWKASSQSFHSIVVEGQNGISQLEYFSPQGNSRGEVLFRAKNQQGLRGIFYWNPSLRSPEVLIKEGSLVPSNEGALRVIKRSGWPGFSGRPCLTDGGEIYIHAVLQSKDGHQNKGSGIFRKSYRIVEPISPHSSGSVLKL